MLIVPTPSIPRGSEPSLQGYYYTSSLFISSLQQDINALLTTYAHAYARDPFEPEKPFELFKSTWKTLGWNYAHLRCVDAKRPVFVGVVGRCFVGGVTIDFVASERVADTSEHPIRRAAALFGLYIWYTTQPKPPEVNMPVADYITIPTNTYEAFTQLHTLYVAPLRTYISFIISQFISQSLFHIIPSTKYHAYNPRDLPHTIPLLTRDIEAGHGFGGGNGSGQRGKKKKGRPSQLDHAQRADKTISELEEFLNKTGFDSNTAPSTMLSSLSEEYLTLKQQLKGIVDPDILKKAEETTLHRVEAAEHHIKRKNLIQDGHYEGLEKLREQIQEQDGLLGLFGGNATRMTGKGKEKEL
ncbi:hypothetical protein Clacol_008512 [Clathrus columnatus]|uniref:Uncharacterized protein n=1 Tax=Clathrus columnatus TaxID=1419009 RepID=A0AAV5ANK6_9AGAM|nr:hypothetical protein Clacol_008512 [Clathrus columnatus]